VVAPIRCGGVPRSYGQQLLVVGDAAGHVDPLTGEGIHTAMVAGKIAAQSVGDMVRAGGNFGPEACRAYGTYCNNVGERFVVVVVVVVFLLCCAVLCCAVLCCAVLCYSRCYCFYYYHHYYYLLLPSTTFYYLLLPSTTATTANTVTTTATDITTAAAPLLPVPVQLCAQSYAAMTPSASSSSPPVSAPG
jgi:hypothetical protein